MKNNLLVKILALGIIVLFIGAGVYPAIAKESITTYSRINKDYESRPVNTLHFIKTKKLLDRLDVDSDILLALSNYNLEAAEICEELLNKISPLKEKDNDRSICDTLEVIYFALKDLVYNIREIYITHIEGKPITSFIFHILAYPFCFIWLMSWVIGYECNCWDEVF